MLKQLNKIKSESKFINPYWEYRIDEYMMPDGDFGQYHYVNSRGSIMVVPVTFDNKYIFIRQYRYLNSKISLEFPGGGVKAGIDYKQNARQELLEEAGYEADNIDLIGEHNPFNGVTNEICRVYLASGLKFIGNKPEASEEFEIIELTLSNVIDFISKGDIWDGMTLSAWALYYFSSTFKGR